MRRVRLHRNAFVNDTYCTSGSVVMLADNAAMAPFMTELPDVDAPVTPASLQHHAAAADKTVKVHYSQDAGEIDIDVNGVEMHIDHAALKVEVD